LPPRGRWRARQLQISPPPPCLLGRYSSQPPAKAQTNFPEAASEQAIMIFGRPVIGLFRGI
jgi:hypothetical protein